MSKSEPKGRKWTRQECRDRYVLGEEISQRVLAKMANRSTHTIGRWAKEEEWLQQRSQYKGAIAAEADKKVIEETSDLLAEAVIEMNREHLELFRTIRQVNAQGLKVLAAEAMGANGEKLSSSDQAKRFAQKGFALSIEKYTKSAIAAAQMERAIAGAKYADINVAIDMLSREGYDVFEKEV